MIDKYFLILPASGIGARMRGNIPKQYLKLDNGLSVLDQTLKTLLSIKQIEGFVIAIKKQDREFRKSKFNNHDKHLATAIGGKERIHSVISALATLKPFIKDNDWVLVHDAVRPCVHAEEVQNLITQLKCHPIGGLLASPVVDTIKRATKEKNVQTTLDRTHLWHAQTPQMYRFGILSKALENAIQNHLNITDESSAIEHLGLKSALIATGKHNFKITTEQDLVLANFYLNQ